MDAILIGWVVVAICIGIYKMERHDFVKYVEDIDWDEDWY